MKRLTTRDESGYYHLRRGPNGGEINKITVVQHLGRLEDVALRPVSREQVERIRGEWIEYEHPHIICCTRCDYGTGPKEKTRFCPYCGAPMTDEAVDMVVEKINNMEEMTNEY